MHSDFKAIKYLLPSNRRRRKELRSNRQAKNSEVNFPGFFRSAFGNFTSLAHSSEPLACHNTDVGNNNEFFIKHLIIEQNPDSTHNGGLTFKNPAVLANKQ